MAAQQHLQDLIRLMTVGMKVPIKDALPRVKALQTKNIKSIQQIAESSLPDIQSAIPDAKAARSLHNACKASLKNPAGTSSGTKRAGSSLGPDAKRLKSSKDTGYLGGDEQVEPHEFEASLELPVEDDEDAIASTSLLTNRAPLVLAFAVELLRYTMPEQPPSSRLSLAQAVVSANSRSKAVSIGLEKGPSADDEGWGHGQPRIRVMGREITVLKRGGYEWKVKDEPTSQDDVVTDHNASIASTSTETGFSRDGDHTLSKPAPTSTPWSASRPITSKESTFIVRAINFTNPSQRQSVLQSLFAAVPSLSTASHNAWAYRAKIPTNLFNATTIKEESFDDGESGCGAFLLKNLQESDTVDTLVVMTRWYGGIMLGPDRWRIMRDCLKGALAERSRLTGDHATIEGEALWGLDLEAMKDKASGAAGSVSGNSYRTGVIGMPVHRPEAARAYLFRSFATRVESLQEDVKHTPKKKSAKVLEAEKEENVSRLLGAIRLVIESWKGHLTANELDRRAWNWYTSVRPEVESGPSGWGAKGHLKLSDILSLRRKVD
ncbi:hypothetical protein F5Y18DRAFT_134583 [Xylariaceae sp. FL1019]|nr:hypothetical protein F5Y18DRAFT_134583 [Xylariaceae sp. FL1019]